MSMPGAAMRQVTLFGAGSPVIVDVEESCARRGWDIAAVVRNMAAPVHSGFPGMVVDSADVALAGHAVLVPLFTPANRRHALQHAQALGATEFPVLVDPTSILPQRIEIAEGSYINAGCTLGAASRIGRFVFVNRGCCLGHHLELDDFASIGPGVVLAGQVSVGAAAMIGAGAVILPGIRIGAGAVVGAGTVVVRDVAPGASVVGRTRA
jgi:hypothetical protein